MPRLPRRPLLVAATLFALATAARGQSPASLFDPRLAGLRRASAVWDVRQGPTRRVVDQVCLVPDVATYYEAIAAWDDRTWFPVLIEDVELTLKFLRAFRPARVVRYPGRVRPIEAGKEWDAAIGAVGAAWSPPDGALSGERPPTTLGVLPSGVILARPESPSLPGLVALAAGRFQPIVRVDSAKGYGDLLDVPAMTSFLAATETAIAAVAPRHDGIGDDCDFVTIAGDYPYRYSGEKGTLAVDDRVGRSGRTLDRWAFTGRVLGDARRSVYAAMCGLFLRPESAMLFNSYPEDAPPWSTYGLGEAARRLRPLLPTQMVAGDRRATIRGWHETFDPINRHGLVFVNTKGGPTQFDLFAGPAGSPDVMPSVPAAVCVIHSYSAADPTDPGTVAGRWLAQGAYLYHGSVDEPYLNAFRPPGLVADLLAEGLPFSAATRATLREPFGQPWKLTLLGDPLVRLARRGPVPERLPDLAATASWPSYVEKPHPAADASPSARLAWAVSAAIARRASAPTGDQADDLIAVLRTLPRAGLDPASRSILDELTFVLLIGSNRVQEARAVLLAIPPAERSPTVTRLATSAILADFQRSLARRDLEGAGTLWSVLLRLDGDRTFKVQLTGRVAAIADTPPRREDWRNRIRSVLPSLKGTEAGAVAEEEAKRVEEALKADRARPGR